MDEELSRYVIEELEGLEEGVRQGSGSFGSVYKVRVNGMPCIAKRLHDILSNRQVAVSGAAGGGTIRERFRNECLLLSRIRHPNIVQFLGVHYGPNSSDLTLVLEHLHMDLEQCLATYPRMPLSIKLGVLKDVSYGLLHLHTRKPPIVHRDLTVSNILVTPDMRAKIADLGVSRLLDISPLQLSNYTACPGTLAYMPPEALRPEPVYDVRLDIFSFGVLALFAAIQEFPNVYYGMDIPEAVQINGKSELHKRGDAMRKLSTGHCLHELIVRCLSDDADKRPVAVEVNRTMKALCVNLPKRFPSVLEMHGEIWKLHGEREQLVKRLSLEKQSSDQSQPSQERPSDDLVQQMLSLREENETLRRKNTEFEERIKELEQQQNDLTPLQQAQQDYEDEVCPLPGGAIKMRMPKKEPNYVNLHPTPPTTSPRHHSDVTTPINPPHLPTSDSSRFFDQQSPGLTERLDTDFHAFPGNGHFSGLSSNMSSASTGSQPSSVPLDPNLKCRGCDKQFREFEIQEFRRHSSTCEKLQSQLRHVSPEADETGYHEDFHTEEQKFDPNLTCIGCGQGFKETQIQDFSKHCKSCPMFMERFRSSSEPNMREMGAGDESTRSQSVSGGSSRHT